MKRLKLKKYSISSIIIILIIGYFSYHILKGDRGMLAWYRLNKEYNDGKIQVDNLKKEVDLLNNKVTKLRTSICPDLLEEQAKKILGYAYPQEIIVFKSH